MKLFVYVQKDKKLGAYEAPTFRTDDPEHYKDMMARSLKLVKLDQVDRAADLALYYLGQFDDIKCKFELLDNGAEKLIDYEDYVPRKEELIKDEVK